MGEEKHHLDGYLEQSVLVFLGLNTWMALQAAQRTVCWAITQEASFTAELLLSGLGDLLGGEGWIFRQ